MKKCEKYSQIRLYQPHQKQHVYWNLFTYSIKGEHELKEKTCNDVINHVCKLIVGVKGNLKKIFLHDFVDFEEETSFKICEDKFEIDILPELQNKFPKEADVLEKSKLFMIGVYFLKF